MDDPSGQNSPSTVRGSPFPLIEDYAFISDTEVCALIAPSGNVRWVAGADVRYFQPARGFWERIQDVVYMIFPQQLY